MKNVYSREIKDKAKAMFIQGKCFSHIASDIGCNFTTVSRWAKNEGWLEERYKLYTDDVTLSDHISFTLGYDGLLEEMQAYQAMFSKGLIGLKQNKVKSTSEASRLIEKAIKGIGSVRQDSLQISFIEKVAAVLRSEISDRDLLCRIAEGCRKIDLQYRHATLK